MATAAGNLIVHLMAKTDRFDKSMRRSSAQTDLMRSSVSKLSGSMKMMAGAFGVSLGAGGLIMGLKQSIGLAEEQIKQEQKLAAVLDATGHAAGWTADQLKQHAAALQQTTNFGDEATIGAQAVLATFKEIRGDVFKDATSAILDMSAVLNTDLQGAAIQVGKALNDPIRGVSALSRVGVSFTQQQKDQIKAMQEMGDVAGAQGVILAELAGEFGGAAEAMANPVTQLKNAMGDLGESIGMQVLPFARMLADDLTEPTSAAADAAKQSASEFGGLAGAIFTAVDAAQALVVKFKEARLASTELFLWNEETGKSWWGWMGEDVEAEAYIDELQRRVKELRKDLDATTSSDWAADTQKRYQEIMVKLQNPGGPNGATGGSAAGAAGSLTDPMAQAAAFFERAGTYGASMPMPDFAGNPLFDEINKWVKDKTQFDELGKSLTESLETPVEALARRMEEVNRLSEFGAITDETRQRALQQIAKEAEQGTDAGDIGPTRFSGAMEAGSREAYSAILAASGAQREQQDKKIADNTAEMKRTLQFIKMSADLQVKLLQEDSGVEIPAA